jgi:hypothetical protein
MFAGAVPNVMPVIRRVRDDLRLRRPPHRLELIDEAFREAYQHYRTQLVNDQILGIYGIDLQAYSENRNLAFTSDERAHISALIENIRVGVEFIVWGYDDNNMAHLFTIGETYNRPFGLESVCREQDGIAVIGCGAEHALRSLISLREPLPIISQAEMLCRVCEAKFDAEQDPEVGRESAAGVVRRPQSRQHPASEVFITLPALQAIRDAYDRRENRPYPSYLVEAVVHCINSNITTERMHEAVARAEQEIIDERLRERYR